MAFPPSQMDDQTDADFFDKLVDDEFGITQSSSSLIDETDFDDTKAFSNLSINDMHPASEEISQISAVQAEETNKEITLGEESTSLVLSNSFSFDTVVGLDASNEIINCTMKDRPGSKSGITSTSVKEVQWSAFNTNSSDYETGGFGSYSDFFTQLNGSTDIDSDTKSSPIESCNINSSASIASGHYHDDQINGILTNEQITDVQDTSSSYWESLYPGWKYDSQTGEWHQLSDTNVINNVQGVSYDESQIPSDGADLDQKGDVSFYHKSSHLVTETIVNKNNTITGLSNWSQEYHNNAQYPPHMYFDPQYPEWYYDMITQEWQSLESYNQTVHTSGASQVQQAQSQATPFGELLATQDSILNTEQDQYGKYQEHSGYRQAGNWSTSSNHTQQNVHDFVPTASHYKAKQQTGNVFTPSVGGFGDYSVQTTGYENVGSFMSYGSSTTQDFNVNAGMSTVSTFSPIDNLYQSNYQTSEKRQQTNLSNESYNNQTSMSYAQHQTATTHISQSPYIPYEGRSSAGRPPHALVAFGFGGKLIVVRDSNSSNVTPAYTSKESTGCSVSILNLVEVVMGKADTTTMDNSVCSYFHTLCSQSFPGPLVGGSAATKEINKWIDERITSCASPFMDAREGKLLKLLLALLKICNQHYGKLRSPFVVGSNSQETDGPESTVAKLFASAKNPSVQVVDPHCLQNMPSEGQLRTTSAEVQNLLAFGKRKEALQRAQEGHLWGPALVLASQLGDKYYVDTVREMAHNQFALGSPLRTLCLLIAGQPGDVFVSKNSMSVGNAAHTPQCWPQIPVNSMLDDWEENLAIIIANRTKDDELVIIHLGDCLWKERGEVIAAHTCYLVAEANFESYSDSSRICLIGADHWKCPRTYASPEAIQRTELYEYSKVLGNSQYILLPLQPYKVIYANMLAEVGKISDSLRYCVAIQKYLKSSGHAPEVETWKSLLKSLEERIRIHQQGGYSAHLGTGNLVGKIMPFIDKSIHRMIGGPPSTSTSQPGSDSSVNINNEWGSTVANTQSIHEWGPMISSKQSTTPVPSLMPSASMEPISRWSGDNDKMTVANRSISEPNFGRSPQVDTSKELATSDSHDKTSISAAPSRFGRFGSQFFQKTIGWVSRSRTDRQAKLGEQNKFYYDEKLKRWVEEGAETPSEETALPPPPTISSFPNVSQSASTATSFQGAMLSSQSASVQNGNLDHKMSNSSIFPANTGGTEFKSPESSPGMPPIPPTTNQFSARGRMGVRSRYVDTFNKDGGVKATNLFHSPSIPVAKPGTSAKFFVPAPVPSTEQSVVDSAQSIPEITNESPTTSTANDSSFSPSPPPPSLPRFPSMDNIAPIGNKVVESLQTSNNSFPRLRAASWSGISDDAFNTKTLDEKNQSGKSSVSMPSFMPINTLSPLPSNNSLSSITGGNYGEDLQEVEL